MRRHALILSILLTLVGAMPVRAERGVDLGAADVAPRRSQLLSLAEIARYNVPDLDLAQFQREDEWWAALGMPRRYAAPHTTVISPRTHGTWESLDEETRLWRLRISSPGAWSLNLGFSRFSLPSGARFHLYSPDGHHELGPFTRRDNEAHGQLWTPPLATDELILELLVPREYEGFVALELATINHGYAGFGDPGPKAGSCNLDVGCAEVEAWRTPARAVGLISVAGSYFCTGFLVNNTARDGRPLFMTARHCGIQPANAASVVVLWNHEFDGCRAHDDPAYGQVRAPGEVVPQVDDQPRFQTGAFWRADDLVSDITLIELDDRPDPAWGVYFAGWDRRKNDPRRSAVIHHPNTDAKRISLDFDRATTSSYLKDDGPGNSSHLRVGNWEVGTTEGGSSGAPLLDQHQRVVGVLHGGKAFCGTDAPDWFGRLSVAWNGGGSATSRLRDWLDPKNTGALALDGLDPRARTFAASGQ